eukprot:15430763-Alexandrium_andersonii.AAC.1
MDGGSPGRVEKNNQVLAKGDQLPESSLQVRGDKELPSSLIVPNASSTMRRPESCIDPAFSTTT